MGKSNFLIFGLMLLALVSPGYGRLGQSAGLDIEDKKDLEEMLVIADNLQEINGYEKSPRKPEVDISSSPHDIHFYLYNDAKSGSFYEIPYGDYDVARAAPYKLNKEWKFLIHGFTQNQNSSGFPQLLVQEYLKRELRSGVACNLVVVDWGRLAYSVSAARLPIYFKAVENVAVAGNRVGEMIEFLRKLPLTRDPATQKKVTPIDDLSKVHIIGFSLGAHVAGIAGDYVHNQFSKQVGRITGLDPAGPRFYAGIPEISGRQLKKADAGCMDIIHTSWNAYGIGKEIGDADFYPNAGPGYLQIQVQPWCLAHHKFTPLVCSHNLAPVFYAMSINHPYSMDACMCGSWISYKTMCPCRYQANMGEYWDSKQVGRYYLDMSAKTLDGGMHLLEI